MAKSVKNIFSARNGELFHIDQELDSGNIFWGLFLVFIGSVFLLNSIDAVSWQVWSYLVNFWPLFVIFLGVRIVIGKNLLGNFLLLPVIILTMVGLLVGVIEYDRALDGQQPLFGQRIAGWLLFDNQVNNVSSTITDEVAKSDYPDVESARLDLKLAFGKLNYQETDQEQWLSLRGELPAGFEAPSLEFTTIETNNVATVNFSEPPRTVFLPVRYSPEYSFSVDKALQLESLKLAVSAGEANLKLSGKNLAQADVDLGAGEIKLQISETEIESRFDVRVGAGKMEMMLPEDTNFKIDYKFGAGEIIVNGEEVATGVASDSEYVYDTERPVDLVINLELGFGEFIISNLASASI